MTVAEYKQFLGSLRTDLARWRSQLTKIDVGSLGLDYERGKMIEDVLSAARSSVEECEKYQSTLAKTETLNVDIVLLSCMEDLSAEVNSLGENLNWLGGNSANARIWTAELHPILREMLEDKNKVFGHVLRVAVVADSSCPQLRRYLH